MSGEVECREQAVSEAKREEGEVLAAEVIPAMTLFHNEIIDEICMHSNSYAELYKDKPT